MTGGKLTHPNQDEYQVTIWTFFWGTNWPLYRKCLNASTGKLTGRCTWVKFWTFSTAWQMIWIRKDLEDIFISSSNRIIWSEWGGAESSLRVQGEGEQDPPPEGVHGDDGRGEEGGLEEVQAGWGSANSGEGHEEDIPTCGPGQGRDHLPHGQSLPLCRLYGLRRFFSRSWNCHWNTWARDTDCLM